MDEPTETDLDPRLERRWAKIRARLESHQEDLLRQGGLVSKISGARRVWAVRFVERRNGSSTHHSIYIGGDDQQALLLRTRRLLDEFRALGTAHQQVAADAMLVGKLGAIARRLAVRRS